MSEKRKAIGKPNTTFAFRLPESQRSAIEEIAQIEGINTSQFMREAVAAHICSYAMRNPELGELVTALAQQTLEGKLKEMQRMFGEAILERLDFPKPSNSPGDQ